MLRIKFERLRHEWTQHRLGVMAGMPQPYVGLIETGRLIPRPDEVLRLAAALQLPPEELLKPVAPIDGPQLEALVKVAQLRARVAKLQQEMEQTQ